MTDANCAISIDIMSGDHGPEPMVEAISLLSRSNRENVTFQLHGREALLHELVRRHDLSESSVEIHPCDGIVAMDLKPSLAMRRGKGTSMWAAIEQLKKGKAQAVLSAGNTGAYMGMAMLQLRLIAGVDRPAIAASWPVPHGCYCVVLDVGAGIEADASQLVQFAAMGEAFMRCVHGLARPRIALLNVGEEEGKGTKRIQSADQQLQAMQANMNYQGYVEGNDISLGNADVVVTDGFTGNVALKTAEGTARLIGGWVKSALTQSLLSKFAALAIGSGLGQLKQKMDPRSVNGGVFLGLNGPVIKSHGGSDAIGTCTALRLAINMARSNYIDEIRNNLERLDTDKVVRAEK